MSRKPAKGVFPATQCTTDPFQARVQQGWGVWRRQLNNDQLEGAFTRREDAEAFAGTVMRDGTRCEVRLMWLMVNLDKHEAYALRDAGDAALQAVDLDFSHRVRQEALRADVLSKLSDAELQALGLKRR